MPFVVDGEPAVPAIVVTTPVATTSRRSVKYVASPRYSTAPSVEMSRMLPYLPTPNAPSVDPAVPQSPANVDTAAVATAIARTQ
jgi:hypothetical protein